MGPETRCVAWRRRVALVLTTAVTMAVAVAPAGASLATHVSDFGTFGIGVGQFHGPVGVTLSPFNDDLYVTDYELSLIHI